MFPEIFIIAVENHVFCYDELELEIVFGFLFSSAQTWLCNIQNKVDISPISLNNRFGTFCFLKHKMSN